MRPTRIFDDRGSPCPLTDPADLPARVDPWTALSVGMGRTFSRGFWKKYLFSYTVIFGIGVAVGYANNFYGYWYPRYLSILLVFCLGPAGVSLVLRLLAPRGMFSREALRTCRRLGVCAACGYDLRGAQRDRDGCTVCPECGAAWRLT